MAQGKRWCFTLNNPDEGEKAALVLFKEWDHAKYGVFQYETGESGTLHAQGYIEFTSNKRLAAVRHLLPRAHWEIARGSAEENTKYCTKEQGRVGEPYIFGDIKKSGQGSRNDLVTVKSMLDQGASDAAVADVCFGSWVRYHNAFAIYRGLASQKRDWAMFVVVVCGPPGSGKSGLAREIGGPDAYWWPGGGEWFDGYESQRVVVLDEFAGGLSWTLLLRLLDRYPLQVQVKGGFREMVARTIFITSNKRPDDWYDREKFGDRLGALFRRISLFMWLDFEERNCNCTTKYIGY